MTIGIRGVLSILLIPALHAAIPLTCPAGAPIGSFQLSVSPAAGGTPRSIQTVNQVLAGYRISYVPANINSPDKKKARIALVLVPSDQGKIVVLEPKPAAETADWTVPVRSRIVSVVFGPQGLDKGKVTQLVAKNDEIIGQLADYAQKTQQTETLIQAITQQQQSLDTGQNVNAAVVSFANQFPSATRLDRTLPADQQLLTLVRGVNPALSAYDPLSTNPSQRAAQSAGLAAAVAGLFFGTDVGLAASGGALLLNMHSLIFPRTEFRSAFAQALPDHKDLTALCGNKAAASRTELAFLWATRIPDSAAPEISLPKAQSLPIGAKSTLPITIKARDVTLAARVQDWKLVSAADSKLAVPIPVKVNTEAKTAELDTENPKLTTGAWKLAGSWDWDPLTVAGDIDLHPFSEFKDARLTPDSQDRLIQGAGKVLVSLNGGDFEFVEKLSWKNSDDKFAQPLPLPFSLPKGPRAGPETTLESQIDTGSLKAGNYQFLIAQNDGKVHDVPFKVLPAPPQVSNVPLLVNIGADPVRVVLRGAGLDRIESLAADPVQITLDDAKRSDERVATVKLNGDVKPGQRVTLHMKVKDFEQPVSLTDALLVAGPRPAITGIRASLPPDAGVALQPGEIPANSTLSFALDVSHAAAVSAVQLSCGPATGVSINAGESRGNLKLRQESPNSLYLAFNPEAVGQPGCMVMAKVVTTDNGESLPAKLGSIVRLPKIESFQLTDERANDNAYYGLLKGQDLESIAKVGWDRDTGTPVEAIPAPSTGGVIQETLRVALSWPAPSPHAPLYVWLRGEEKGRLTTAKW